MPRHGLLGLLVATLVLASAAPAQAGQAVAYQQDPGHTGVASEPGLDPPFVRRWSADLGGETSYAVVADGRVFAVVRNPSSGSYGTRVVALDPAAGGRLWERQLTHTYYWAGIAYGAGTLVVVTYDGEVSALDPATGTPRWSKDLGDSFSSEPTVEGNTVYVDADGQLVALDVASGAQRWASPTAGGGHSAPSVSGGRVHVGFSCDVYAFATSNGAQQWRHNEGCSGSGGKTTVAAGGRLYARDSGDPTTVFDAASGQRVGTLPSRLAAVAAGDTLFYVRHTDGALVAASASTLQVGWTRPGSFTTAPLLLNDSVIVGTSSGLAAFDRVTGAERWSDKAGPAALSPDEHNVSSPLAGLAAGEGLLIAATSSGLVAYVHGIPPVAPAGGGGAALAPLPGRPPPSRSLRLDPVRTDLFVGERTRLRAAITGLGAVAAQPVALEVDEWPYDGYVAAGRAVTDRRGRATFRVRPSRNARFRAVLVPEPEVQSPATDVFVDFPGALRKVGAGGKRPRVVLVVAAPPDAALRGTVPHAYLARSPSGPFRRVSRTRWRDGPRGTIVAILPFPRGTLRRSHEYAVCFQEAEPDGFGRQTIFDRLCGRSRIPRWVTR